MIKQLISLLFVLGLPVVTVAQTDLPENIEQEIQQECIEYDEYNLRKICIEQNIEAYESWSKFTTDPEFENISEITARCSIDWPSYMMRVECVMLETKALVRMNNLVNIHGISKAVIIEAVNTCSEFQDMSYMVLEQCIRENVVKITGNPLP